MNSRSPECAITTSHAHPAEPSRAALGLPAVALLLCLVLPGRSSAADGTWPPASLVLPEGDTSARWDLQDERFIVPSGVRHSQFGDANYPGYSHTEPEYVLGNRVGVRVPNAVRPALGHFGRFDGELDLVPEDACISAGHVINADNTAYGYCSGWWPLFSADRAGWRNGTVNRMTGANPRFVQLLYEQARDEFDLDDWLSDPFAIRAGGDAFARVANGREEGGFPSGPRFAWGDDIVVAEVESTAAAGRTFNDPDAPSFVEPMFPWGRVDRIESDMRVTASLPFRIVQQPGTPTGSITLGRIRVRLDNPIDVGRPPGMGAWRIFSFFAPVTAPCEVASSVATYDEDQVDCSRLDLVRAVSISDAPRGVEVPVAEWLGDTPRAPEVLDQRFRWLQWTDLSPWTPALPENTFFGNRVDDEAAIDALPLRMDTDVPLATPLWLNLFAQSRIRVGRYDEGLIVSRVAETVRVRARVRDAIDKADEPGWLELDPTQPGAESLQIIASAAAHKARLVDDLLPGPGTLHPRILAQHPDALLLAVGDVPLAQRQLMLWQGPGQSRLIDLPPGSQVRRVALAERGFLVELIGLPPGEARLKLIDPLTAALRDATDPAITPLGLSANSVNAGFAGWRGDRGETWFSAVDERSEDFPNQLWRSDGTPEGTRLEATVGDGNYHYDPMGRVGPHLVFAANSRDPADETDERANGVFWSVASGVLERLPMRGAYSLRAVARVGQQLVIQAYSALPSTGVAIWSTDGTPAGTYRLDDPAQAASLTLDLLHWDEFSGIALLMGSRTGSAERTLWATDGSPGSLVQIAALPSGWEVPVGRVAWHDGYLYFALNHTRVKNGELWRTDGTPSGTQRIDAPWSADPEQGHLFALRSINGFLVYARAPERSYWRPPLTRIQQATFPELWIMTQPEVQWKLFHSQLPGQGQGTASPLSHLMFGDLSDLTAWRNGVLWVATGDPAVSTHLSPVHGEELFGFDTVQPTLIDPNYSRLPREGALPPPPYTGPLIRRIWSDGFEDVP